MDDDISRRAYERMRTLGISFGMVARALNAPDRVQHLPQSNHVSYFCEIDGRSLRVMTTLDYRVVTVSWADTVHGALERHSPLSAL